MSDLPRMPVAEALESVAGDVSAAWNQLRGMRRRAETFLTDGLPGGQRARLEEQWRDAVDLTKRAAIALEDLGEELRKAANPEFANVKVIDRRAVEGRKAIAQEPAAVTAWRERNAGMAPPKALVDAERLRAFFAKEWDGYVRDCGSTDAPSYIMGDAAADCGVTDDELVRATFSAWRSGV